MGRTPQVPFQQQVHQERRTLAKGRLLATPRLFHFPQPPKFYLSASSLPPLQRPNLRNSLALSASNFHQPKELKQHQKIKKKIKTPIDKYTPKQCFLAFFGKPTESDVLPGQSEQPQLAANPRVARQHIHTPDLPSAHLGRQSLS